MSVKGFNWPRLVWRYIDNNNYYLARFNPLENNFRLYRVVNGSRKQLKSKDSNVKSNVWFTLKIEMKGSRVSCSINGDKIIDLKMLLSLSQEGLACGRKQMQ